MDVLCLDAKLRVRAGRLRLQPSQLAENDLGTRLLPVHSVDRIAGQ